MLSLTTVELVSRHERYACFADVEVETVYGQTTKRKGWLKYLDLVRKYFCCWINVCRTGIRFISMASHYIWLAGFLDRDGFFLERVVVAKCRVRKVEPGTDIVTTEVVFIKGHLEHRFAVMQNLTPGKRYYIGGLLPEDGIEKLSFQDADMGKVYR